MNNILSRYRRISRSVLFLISASFLIHLVNASFILILNIYLRKSGYADNVIAELNSYRFLGILTFAFPLGIFIKGKALKPFFIASSILVPLTSAVLLYTIENGYDSWIIAGFIAWGISFMILNVCSLPFIMRSESEDVVTEARSLAAIFSGTIINRLSKMSVIDLFGHVIILDEYHIMMFIIALSSLSIFLVLFIKEAKPRSKSSSFLHNIKVLRSDYDWLLIFRVLVPNILIAVGAGLTIPFVNLFFNSVFGMDSGKFSLIGAFTAGLVFLSTLAVPFIRRRFGFRVAVLIPQWTAIFFLVLLAFSQMVSAFSWAVYIAIGAYILRQPLMNMAGPVTSELGMKYVGTRNQELISALSSSIWSASWFISAKIFQILRQLDLDYYLIFLITSVLYAIGVMFYHLLINDYLNREKTPDQSPA
jgi:hypothetical protein